MSEDGPADGGGMRGGTSGRRTGLAGLATAAAVTAAVLAPASAQAATSTVRGVVTADGRPVAGVEVGTWSAARGVVTRGRTDSRGRFVLHSPSDAPVEAWAGVTPAAARAVFALGDRHLVRGVIGDAQPKGEASPLWQRGRKVVPSRLGAGGLLRFRLQSAGRITAPVPDGGTGRIALQHGTITGPWFHAANGMITSGWLVPGTFTVYVDPKPGRLAARARVRVPSGTTATTLPANPVGTTVRIHATSGGSPLPAGVPVIEQRAEGEGMVPPTDATGTATAESVTPGRHRYTVGKLFNSPDEGYGGQQPTSKDYLPATAVVDVAAGQQSADVAVDLVPASKISGTLSVTDRSAIRLFAEDADGDVVRIGYADAGGAFTIGGLRSGSYAVIAEDLATHRYDRITVPVGAGATTALPHALTPATPDPVLQGTVAGGRPGSVIADSGSGGAVLLSGGAEFGASGAYRAPLPPGRFALVVVENGRAERTAATVLVDDATVRRDLQPGPARARAVVRFTAYGNVVRPGYAALSDDGRDELDLVARTNDGGLASSSVPPGHYMWTPAFSVPVADGPWSWSRPAAFTLRPGVKQDLGTLAVTIRG